MNTRASHRAFGGAYAGMAVLNYGIATGFPDYWLRIALLLAAALSTTLAIWKLTEESDG